MTRHEERMPIKTDQLQGETVTSNDINLSAEQTVSLACDTPEGLGGGVSADAPVMLPDTLAARLLSVASDQPCTPLELFLESEARYARQDNHRLAGSACKRLHKRGFLFRTGQRPRPGRPQPLYVITEAGREMQARLEEQR